MSELTELAKNAARISGNPARTKNSAFDDGLLHQYGLDNAQQYAYEAGGLSTSTYEAECQGLDPNDFYKYVPVKIRSSYATSGISGELMPDDFQRVHILAPVRYRNIPTGAYINYAGNTWICFKPRNMEAVYGRAVVRRCNAVINTLDWYGNIVSVPFSYQKMSTLGNAPSPTDNSILAKAYINCVCQLNEISEKFTENTRMILGKSAYTMQGLNDFTREFTDNPDSIHLLSFTISRQEPLAQDSIEKQCADYHSFKWEITLTASDTMKTGAIQTIKATSRRNGENVSTTKEHPIRYKFKSSNANVATVDNTGRVEARSAGTVIITAFLEQNPEIFTSTTITVAESGNTGVEFITPPPEKLSAFDTVTIKSAVYDSGTETADTVTWSFTGAPARAYKAETSGNTLTLTAYSATNTLLTITATCNGNTATAQIRLTA